MVSTSSLRTRKPRYQHVEGKPLRARLTNKQTVWRGAGRDLRALGMASFPKYRGGLSLLDPGRRNLEEACVGHLPDQTGMPFVLVQHLDPRHESALTQCAHAASDAGHFDAGARVAEFPPARVGQSNKNKKLQARSLSEKRPMRGRF